VNSVISVATYLPGVPFVQKAIRFLARYGHDGPVRTQYGFWIQYSPGPAEAAGLRRAAISGSSKQRIFAHSGALQQVLRLTLAHTRASSRFTWHSRLRV